MENPPNFLPKIFSRFFGFFWRQNFLFSFHDVPLYSLFPRLLIFISQFFSLYFNLFSLFLSLYFTFFFTLSFVEHKSQLWIQKIFFDYYTTNFFHTSTLCRFFSNFFLHFSFLFFHFLQSQQREKRNNFCYVSFCCAWFYLPAQTNNTSEYRIFD